MLNTYQKHCVTIKDAAVAEAAVLRSIQHSKQFPDGEPLVLGSRKEAEAEVIQFSRPSVIAATVFSSL